METKDWVAAVRHLSRVSGDQGGTPAIAGYEFHSVIHPFSGHQLAIARGGRVAPDTPTETHATAAYLTLCGARTGAGADSIVLGWGLRLYHVASAHMFLDRGGADDLIAGLIPLGRTP